MIEHMYVLDKYVVYLVYFKMTACAQQWLGMVHKDRVCLTLTGYDIWRQFQLVTVRVCLTLTGNARIMGEVAAKCQHLQDGAEAEPSGCAGRAQLLRHLLQRTKRVQVHDQHEALK